MQEDGKANTPMYVSVFVIVDQSFVLKKLDCSGDGISQVEGVTTTIISLSCDGAAGWWW